MKALSIRQPWAWAIIAAGKDIENRSWPTRYRGPVLIHTSKSMTRTGYEHCLHTMHWISRRHPFPEGLTLPSFRELERGGIVGKARIVDCVSQHPSPWFFGPYGFVLADVEPVTFQPCKGALGFFNIEAT
jgi:hypothetical protein